MANIRGFHSVLSAVCVLLLTACASQPAPGSLDERYFQTEIKNYQKFELEGQTVYCQNEAQAASRIPYKRCISEPALRQLVANWRRTRNPVERGGPPYMATVPGG